MTKTGLDPEPRRSADRLSWRRVWLASVMMEYGRPLPPKIARSTTRDAKRNLTGRLYHLRRLECPIEDRGGIAAEIEFRHPARHQPREWEDSICPPHIV